MLVSVWNLGNLGPGASLGDVDDVVLCSARSSTALMTLARSCPVWKGTVFIPTQSVRVRLLGLGTESCATVMSPKIL